MEKGMNPMALVKSMCQYNCLLQDGLDYQVTSLSQSKEQGMKMKMFSTWKGKECNSSIR